MKSLSALALFASLLVSALQFTVCTDTQRLVNAVCETKSFELVVTLVSLPVLGEDALKASSFLALRRFSPSEGNLSVRRAAARLLSPK